MALSFTQIKEQFLDAEDNPLTGTAEFAVNAPLYATGVPVMLPGVPVQAQIINGQLVNDSGGTLELADLASTDLVIEGSQTGFWFYTVAITVAGQVLPPWSFFLEHSATPIDLFSLANTPAGGGSAISSVFGRTGTVVAASGDYSVGQVTGAAPSASPAFTGTPTAPTASALTGDTQVATTAYADAAVAVEKSRAQTAEGILATAVTTETDRAETAEGLLIPLAQKGAASGVATLNGSGLVPEAELAPVGSPVPSKYAGLTYGAVWGWPWRFWPDVRGAKMDGRVVEDMAVSGGSLNNPTSASANFTSADVGKYILGWTGSTWYRTQITTINSTSSVIVSPALPGAFSGMGAAIGTDDMAAHNAIRADAYAYALGGPQEAEIYIPPLLSCLAGPASTAYSGNAQIQLPALDPATQLSISLSIRSDGVPAGARHWLQPGRDLPGAVLLCMRTDGSLDSTYGPACVIGGPFNTYGGGSQKFSNARLNVDGLTISAPYPSGYSGIIARGIGQAAVGDYTFMPLGATPSGGPWPQYNPGGPSTDQWTTGLWLPDVGNNFLAYVRRYLCYGLEVALAGSEHCTADYVGSVFNGFGILPVNAAGGGIVCHGLTVRSFECEETSTPIGVLTGGPYATVSPIGLMIQEMNLESYSTPVVLDNGGFLYGKAAFGDNQGPGHYYGTALVTAGSPFKLVNYDTAAGFVSSPQAPPASGSPWLNGYYQDAEITLSVSGGTLSELLTDSTAEYLPASCTLYKFTVPSGHTYTPTLAGGSPVLSHKVKLLGP